ncbi:MAG TPA: prenyltransferase/squalene oxidase repeat-containing protein [Caldilineaceae bacterium]|nr:prenyltransferase/squalene oxidase repeat-containing protein [Caldilineaceae bacterium]
MVGVAAALMGLLAACMAGAPASTEVEAEGKETVEGGQTAALVIQLDPARLLVREVAFTEPISGLVALQRSGLEIETADFAWGTAVCRIEDTGCPAEDCFCGGDTFWNYATWDGASWQSYPVGPAASVISRTGAVEGWRWGEFEGPATPAPQALAAQSALEWLRAQQTITDGSYGGMGASVEALLAVAANALDADQWQATADAPSLLDYVLANAAQYSRQGTAEAGKLAVALVGAEACWPEEALTPTDHYSPTLGALASDAGPLAWGILGTLALGEPAPAESVSYLLDLALPEGGWEWSPGWGRDTNSTALAIQALIAAGEPVTASAVMSGLAYLKSAQLEGGGFSYDPAADWGNVADANSTAYVLQALAAAGMDPRGGEWRANGAGPVDFLLSVQSADGGFVWQAGQPVNLSATVQAIPALLGRAYPLRRAVLEPCTAIN